MQKMLEGYTKEFLPFDEEIAFTEGGAGILQLSTPSAAPYILWKLVEVPPSLTSRYVGEPGDCGGKERDNKPSPPHTFVKMELLP